MKHNPPTVAQLARAIAFVKREFKVRDRIEDEWWAEGLAFGEGYEVDADDRADAEHAKPQLTDMEWSRIAARAVRLRSE